MAFPAVATTATTVQNNNTTNHTINLASGIAVGDQLIVIHTTRRWAPASWTSWRNLVQSDTRSWLHMTVVEKIADGSDALAFSVISNGYTAICYRIPWAVIAGSAKDGSTSTADPDSPNLNIGVAKDYLWLSLASVSWGWSRTITDEPANYINGIIASNFTDSNQFTTTAGATRELNASAENPWVWDITGTDPSTYFWRWSATIALELPVTGDDIWPWEMLI
jgi:hypothetical protein